MSVTGCAAVYPRGTPWSLADCCESGRRLTASQWQNLCCSREGVPFLFTCLSRWISVVVVSVQTRTPEYRKGPDVTAPAGTALISLCAASRQSSHDLCTCWHLSCSVFADLPNKIMQIKLRCKQPPEKCKQIAPSLLITSANCLSFKINPPKLAPFAP